MSFVAVTVIGATASLAAGGLSYYGNQQAADNATAVAGYNSAIQRQNADIKARMQVRQSEINQSLLQTQVNQSYTIDQQALETLDAAGIEGQRLAAQRNELISAQRSAYAKGGVLMEGTPLAVLAHTTSTFAEQGNLIGRQADQKARSLEMQAHLTRLGLITEIDIQKMNASAALAGLQIENKQADLTLAMGQSQSQQYQLAGYGSLLSTVGQSMTRLIPLSGQTSASSSNSGKK